VSLVSGYGTRPSPVLAEFLFRFLEVSLGHISVDIVEGHDPEALLQFDESGAS
jgi:hypothetical protein